MKGFNFQTKKIEKMEDYFIILGGTINYQKDYLEVHLNDAIDFIEAKAKSCLPHLENEKNYNIILQLDEGDDMDFDDMLNFFNIFSFVIAMKFRQKNDKGYLAPNKDYYERMLSSKFTMLHIMNHDYDFGTIQITLQRKGKDPISWVE